MSIGSSAHTELSWELFEQLAVGVVSASLDRRVLRCNRRATEILGYAADELTGIDFLSLTPADDAPVSLASADLPIREASDRRVVRKDGAVIWCHIVLSMHRDAAGAPAGFIATVEDITARKGAEAALRESEARLREAQRIAHVGSFTWDLATHEHRWSEEQYRIWEIPPGTPITLPALQARIHVDDVALVDAAFTEAATHGTAIEIRQRLVMPDGRIKHLYVRAEAILEGGRPVGLFGTLEDITASVEAQRALRARDEEVRNSEARLRRMFDASGDIITLTNAEGRFTFVSGNVERIYSCTSSELTQMGVFSRTHPADRERQASFRRALLSAPGARQRVEIRMRRKDDAYIWVEIASVNLLHDPAIRGILSSTRDVTERKRAEEDLQRMNAELERRVAERTAELADLYDNAPCGYHSLAADGTFLRVNETELRWLGRTRDELIGRIRFVDLLTPEGVEILAAYAPELSETGEITDVDVSLVQPDGSVRAVSLSATQIRDASGALVETRGSIVDTTRRKQAEEGLRASRDAVSLANAALESASRAKDEFLASMSHELRTPLNAVLGLSEALREGVYGPLGDRHKRALQRIDESGRHLLSLLSDILDISKIEAGRMALEDADIAVEDVCDASLRMIQEAARKKRHRVSFQVGAGAGYLRGDELRVKQILVNLLSNAVKFTPEDGEIGLDIEEDDVAEGIRFSVWDTGIGIRPEDQARLFQPFMQLDSSLSRSHAGTGLGLALVRKLVELHSGSLALESAPGLGSRFTVTLPRRRQSAHTALATPSRGLPRVRATGTGEIPKSSSRQSGDMSRRSIVPGALRILLADDDELNVSTFSDFLRAHGYAVDVARNGREALTLAAETHPDIVLMDVQMPLMDGLTAIRALRASENPGLREVPVIALTALAMAGDRERCLEAGADEYLTKPVGLKQLLAEIEARISG